MSYTWDFEEVKKRRKRPFNKDIDFLYQKIVKGYDLTNSIRDALDAGKINQTFSIRTYKYHMGMNEKYKKLMYQKKETYRLNSVRVTDLHKNGFCLKEIELITGFEYIDIYQILFRNK
jgi:hypothetical protein